MDTYGDYMVTNPSQTQAVATIVVGTMDARGVSVKSLADSTGISRSTLTRRLTGHSPFTINELDAIAASFDLKASDIMAEADARRAA